MRDWRSYGVISVSEFTRVVAQNMGMLNKGVEVQSLTRDSRLHIFVK